MAGFSVPEDIVNRGIQRLGGDRITSLLTGTSKEAVEANACYDKLRVAELSSNLWRFSIRRVILRALGTALATWDSTVTYVVGSLIAFNGVNYISIRSSNINQQPDIQPTYWIVFTGLTGQKIVPPTWAIGTTYVGGALITGSDGLIYLSMSNSNVGHDPTSDTGQYWQQYVGNYIASAYNSGTSYNVGELVFDSSNLAYYSTLNGNVNVPATGIGWTAIGGSVSTILMVPWPAGTGPVTDSGTKNIFALPYGYLYEAPQNPNAGDYSALGYPSNAPKTDWVLEGSYLISNDTGPFMFRFGADISQVSLMHPMFCEMLGNRVAYELCETLTNSNTKQTAIGQEYTIFKARAVTRNGIETGSVQPPLDPYLACRF